MKQARLTVFALLSAFVLGFGLAQEDIDSVRQQYADLYNRGDIAGLVGLYTEDATLYNSSGEVVESRAAVQENLQGTYDAGATQISIEATETEVVGDTAYDIGSYTFTSAEGETVASGNYMVILKQVDGEWRIHRHIANQMMPMQGMGEAEGESADPRSTIEAANERFISAYNQGSAAGVAALYTEDAQLLPPNSEVVEGREAIQGVWQGMIDSGIQRVQLDISEVSGMGDTLYEVSNYTLYGADEEMLGRGKYIIIWKQEDGEWRIHRDIFNSSMPPAGQ